MLCTQLARIEARGQGQSALEIVCDTLGPQDVFTYQLWESDPQ